tara:strand:+ start:54 stop:1268 length:1215 start_codon:yes stop_codon:yes gene_type:complete
MKKFICKHPWAHFEVNNPNGNVTMCCNNDTVLGNVNEKNIDDIWNGESFVAIRERMKNEGAQAFCPHTCPVLRGGKKYENLDWFSELDEEGEPRRNAELNENEFRQRLTRLKSKPRWFRFTYSYACNLDCYHCYQREDAKVRAKLPQNFINQIPDYARSAQVVYPFGGEPFYFGPVVKLLENHNANLETRFYFITNATLITDRNYAILKRVPITCMAVSLDAATPESFEALRVRGRNADWNAVMANLVKLKELKSRKPFTFTLSMTLNSVNALEIEKFVELALSNDAEPLISLVANPFSTYDFQKKYLTFTDYQFRLMQEQIDSSLPLVEAKKLDDASIYLRQLRSILQQHKRTSNGRLQFQVKQAAKTIFHALPEQLQIPVRTTVQKIRINQLNRAWDQAGHD